MVFRDQIVLYSQPGALPGNMLEDLLTQVTEIDMDDVRKQIADNEAEDHDHSDDHDHEHAH
jgi:thioredoxin 1